MAYPSGVVWGLIVATLRTRYSRRMRTLSILIAVTCLACGDARDSGDVEATSLLGERLARPVFAAERAAELEGNLAAARAAYEAAPDSEEAAIWVGRRLAYLGRYKEAIAWYTESLDKHPESFRLLRHRGHRYISIRDLDASIADLGRAADLIAGVPDEVEADGAPNAQGIPRSTNHSNIFYHLGLAHYLNGDFEGALAAYERGAEFSGGNDDKICSSAHWLYLTLRRLGRDAEAQEVLAPIHADMDVIENFAYHRALLFYKGELTAEEALGSEEDDDMALASAGYGVATWRLVEGDAAGARALFLRIVAECNWAAFGRIAAEAELARL